MQFETPPSREELERLSLADLIATAQALGADVSYAKERNEIIDALASQRRQQLSRYAEELQKFKIRLEGQAQEMELSRQHYQTTYDRVEQAVSDKFIQLHDLLVRKEVEVKGHLLYLKNKGDSILEDSTEAMLRELDMLNDTITRCQTRSLDVLDITPSSSSITVSVPTLTGRCFDFHDLNQFDLSPLRITLDLQPGTKQMKMDPPYVPKTHPSGGASAAPQYSRQHQSYDAPQQYPSYASAPDNRRSYQPAARVADPGAYAAQAPAPPPSQHPKPQRAHSSVQGVDALTLTPSDSFEMQQTSQGLHVRMLSDAPEVLTGAKALEIWNGGTHVWMIRCDHVERSMVGVVDSTDQTENAASGFFWSPTKRLHRGAMGRASPQLAQIPVVQSGDVLKLTFDADAGTLRVGLNGIDRGLLATELFGIFSPCFIFARGESLTLMQ